MTVKQFNSHLKQLTTKQQADLEKIKTLKEVSKERDSLALQLKEQAKTATSEK